jgi:hypothetical protein
VKTAVIALLAATALAGCGDGGSDSGQMAKQKPAKDGATIPPEKRGWDLQITDVQDPYDPEATPSPAPEGGSGDAEAPLPSSLKRNILVEFTAVNRSDHPREFAPSANLALANEENFVYGPHAAGSASGITFPVQDGVPAMGAVKGGVVFTVPGEVPLSALRLAVGTEMTLRAQQSLPPKTEYTLRLE